MFLRDRGKEESSNDVVPLITSHSEYNGCSPPPLTDTEEDTPPVVQEAWTTNNTNNSSEETPSAPLPPTPTQVVIQQPTPSTGPRFRDVPVIMTDGNGVPFTTELRYVNGLFTWVVVGVTCVIAGSCCCPCLGLVPLCVNQLKDIEHINPETRRVVGKFDRGASFGL